MKKLNKAQDGGVTQKTMGRSIGEKAAARKVAKGKGVIVRNYPRGSEEKGSYVGFSKESRNSDGPFKSMANAKPARPIRKKGGAVGTKKK